LVRSAPSWYLSLPRSDSVAVSVLEAMANGMLPVLSDLPANRELVQDGVNGHRSSAPKNRRPRRRLRHGSRRARRPIADHNRAWVRQHALFGPCVQAFVERLRAIDRVGDRA
jgi:hypothetical protein